MHLLVQIFFTGLAARPSQTFYERVEQIIDHVLRFRSDRVDLKSIQYDDRVYSSVLWQPQITFDGKYWLWIGHHLPFCSAKTFSFLFQFLFYKNNVWKSLRHHKDNNINNHKEIYKTNSNVFTTKEKRAYKICITDHIKYEVMDRLNFMATIRSLTWSATN